MTFDRLPLLLVTAMLLVACGIELALAGRLEWIAKLPLALLLGVAFARGGRARRA